MTDNALFSTGMKRGGIYIILAVVLIFISTIDFCISCTGWDTINPLCLAGYASCIGMQGTVHLIMRGFAILFTLIGGWKILRG